MGTPTPGPGKFSKRTDKAVAEANRSLPNAGYGEQASYQEAQQGMKSQAPDNPSIPFTAAFGAAGDRVTGIGEPSAMPDVPVTDGAATGPGAGADAISGGQDPDFDRLKAYMPALLYMADNGSSDAARNLVRKIQSMAG